MGIFVIAVICILWLMIAEPIYEIYHMKKHEDLEHPDPNKKGISDIIVQ
jgi:hypothetical protein